MITPEEIEDRWSHIDAAVKYNAGSGLMKRRLRPSIGGRALWGNPCFSGWEQVEVLAPGDAGIRQALLVLARSARIAPLKKLIHEQLADPSALSRFVPRPGGGFRRAIGHPRIAAFLGGGAGLASWPVFLLGLVAGSGVFARMTESDREWPRLFKSTLAEIDPSLAACIESVYWPSGDVDAHRRLVRDADLVLAYGSDATMAEVRQHVPASSTFLPFGSRLSAGFIIGSAALESAATLAAIDVAMYDQSGCLSPQVFFVEGDAARGQKFSMLLAGALKAANLSLPPRPPLQQMAIRAARDVASFEEGVLVLGPADLRWTVLFGQRSALELSPLGRTARVRCYRTPVEVGEALCPYAAALQAAGVAAGSEDELSQAAEWLAGLGFSRIGPVGAMQSPTLAWSHDGRGMLTAMVRFVDLEC